MVSTQQQDIGPDDGPQDSLGLRTLGSDHDAPYERIAEDPPARRAPPPPSIRALEAQLRMSPSTPPETISWIDAMDEKRELVAHLRDRHNRVAPHAPLDELRAIHRALDEGER